MLIDLHAHTSGISKCCRIPAPEVLRIAKENGIDGIVLSNHYQKSYVKDMTVADFASKYIEEYAYTKSLADEMGMKIFFGIEVTMSKCDDAHVLVYGLTPVFLREYPDLYDYTLEELYTLVRARGGALVHAHPYRHGKDVLDLNYLDGVEVNCHPLYDDTHCDRLYEIAKNAGVMLTCGGDFHADTYRPKCGVFLDDSIKTEQDLAKYILTAENVKLRVHELRTPEYTDREFKLCRSEKYKSIRV
jgi:predicted metal-dependent phosphoesterase TrpH